MKKIIELAERMRIAQKRFYTKSDGVPRKVAYADLKTKEQLFDDELARHWRLEQTPITEDWLKEHGFEKKEMYWIWVYPHDKKMWLEWYPYEERLSRFVHCVDEWDNHTEKDELTDRIHCFNLAQMLDALELCNIQID